ncbi:MAG: formimidoylglutamate deiminase [Kangiella sp.]|nr:MAG: formimidoylglutamate deiminase [Kangiella sp.]
MHIVRHKVYAENILIGSDWQTEVTLTIDNGIITSISSGKEEDAVALNGPVIPGMINCHSHAFQRAFAGFSEYRGNTEDSFWSWRDIMYKFVAKMSPEDAHVVAKFVYIEMLKAGYTSVGEFHYLHHQANGVKYDDPAEMSHQVIMAADEVGISITHLPVLYTYAGFGKKDPSKEQSRFIHSTQDYLELVNQLNKNYSNRSNFKLGIAPHSLRAVSREQLNEIIPFIRQLNPKAPIHIHIAEQLKEVDDCLVFYKQRPVEWLLNNFEMDEHWCLIHATHLTEQEIKNTANSGAVVGICPLTEANLGDGIFPTAEFSKFGGKFAIGSDSHIGINVAEELRLLEYAQRLIKHQRAVMVDDNCKSVGQYIFTKTCKDGASSLNQNAGEIAVGRDANFLVLDENEPSLFSKKDSFILDASIFACNQLPVKDVYVAGEKVIENGHHRLQEEAKKQYRKVLKKLI